MELKLSDIESSSRQNFLDYIRNDVTRIKYTHDLDKFLELIPTKIFSDNNITCNDKTESFVMLVNQDVKLGKQIVNDTLEN